MALLQTSIAKNGNHPGLVIFDEPAQHSIVTADMESLIQSVLDLKDSCQVIVGITLNNEELKEAIEKLPKHDANVIEIGDRAFQLLQNLVIRQARLSEYSKVDALVHNAIFDFNKSEINADDLQESKFYSYIKDFSAKENDVCFVAKENGNIIGMALARTGNSYAHVDNRTPEVVISIASQYRRKGIGTTLLSILFESLGQKGYEQISLAIPKSSSAASFFATLEFKVIKETDHDYLMVKHL